MLAFRGRVAWGWIGLAVQSVFGLPLLFLAPFCGLPTMIPAGVALYGMVRIVQRRRRVAAVERAQARARDEGMNGRLEQWSIDSESLRGNPLGDPTRRTMPVYLPPGYAEGSARYPVVYFLHGFSGSGRGG